MAWSLHGQVDLSPSSIFFGLKRAISSKISSIKVIESKTASPLPWCRSFSSLRICSRPYVLQSFGEKLLTSGTRPMPPRCEDEYFPAYIHPEFCTLFPMSFEQFLDQCSGFWASPAARSGYPRHKSSVALRHHVSISIAVVHRLFVSSMMAPELHRKS